MKRELKKIKGKLLTISERVALPVGARVILEDKENTKYCFIYCKKSDGDFYIEDGIWGRFDAECEKVNIYEIKAKC